MMLPRQIITFVWLTTVPSIGDFDIYFSFHSKMTFRWSPRQNGRSSGGKWASGVSDGCCSPLCVKEQIKSHISFSLLWRGNWFLKSGQEVSITRPDRLDMYTTDYHQRSPHSTRIFLLKLYYLQLNDTNEIWKSRRVILKDVFPLRRKTWPVTSSVTGLYR